MDLGFWGPQQQQRTKSHAQLCQIISMDQLQGLLGGEGFIWLR